MAKSARKKINLALQGGGAHGAFTWGVLDHLLACDCVEIEAISGTSAGAMNAVVAADGLMRGGADVARSQLEVFWQAIHQSSLGSPVQRNLMDVFMGNWSMDNSPGYHLMDSLTRFVSPYQWNPLNINPLQDVLESVVDFDRVRSCDFMQIFVSATNVETGRVKVFERPQLTADMVMASACLPLLFQAVDVDGVPYWDGGYMGNPVLFPFFRRSSSQDIVVVQINPITRKGAPKTSQAILDRVNEITFNASLLKELRAIDFVNRLLEKQSIDPDKYRQMHVHIIENEDALNPLGASSKLNAEWAFLCHLRDTGRQTAEAWLARHEQDLGQRSTVNLRNMFQGTGPDSHA